MSETETLTAEDLRNRMFEVLKKRGLVDVLKVRQKTIILFLCVTLFLFYVHFFLGTVFIS